MIQFDSLVIQAFHEFWVAVWNCSVDYCTVAIGL